MLSILIPVYNFEINSLVDDLRGQAERSGVAFEIICFDDGSEDSIKEKHRRLAEMQNVQYEEMSENLGRSAIRNRLAARAQYPYLLFMDGDSMVVSPDYIQKYLAAADLETLVYGGRVYAKEAPAESDLLFHWNYGRQREVMSAEIRAQQPYHAFQTNNFMIPKTIFQEIQFEEKLKQYGHEDTLFGFELRRRKVKMKHIDNPLEHIGLESVEYFLNKTEQGIENLLYLKKDYPYLETRLLKAFGQIDRLGLKGLFATVFQQVKPFIRSKLKKGMVNMRWFDFYKLGLMTEKSKNL